MTIWILALVLFAAFAYLGYSQGAIRAAVCFLGVLLGALFAFKLGPLIKPLFPLVGVTTPFLSWVLPPVTVFVLFQIIFTAIAFAAHRQVNLYYKYKADDLQRLKWERLNQRLGASLGLVTGAAYLVLLGAVIYVAGYLTIQVTDDTAPVALQYLNRARHDLTTSGLEATVAKFDRTPAAYYDTADVVGLIYRNPLLRSRFAEYPPFLTLAEKPEFQEMAKDTEFNQMLMGQDSFLKIYEHARVQDVIKNSDLLGDIGRLDIKDLRQYLETGKSTIYGEENVYGHWQANVGATLLEIKKSSASTQGFNWGSTKNTLTPILAGTTLIFAPENKVYLKVSPKAMPAVAVSGGPAAAKTAGAAAPRRGTGATPQSLTARVNPNPAQDRAAGDAAFRQRYGALLPNQGQAAQSVAAAPVAPAAPPVISPLAKITTGEGTWKRTDDNYSVTFQVEGKPVVLEGVMKDDRLLLTASGTKLICNRE